jgi:hypothetical protein
VGVAVGVAVGTSVGKLGVKVIELVVEVHSSEVVKISHM